MPIDGISYSNAAIFKPTTSEEIVQQAEHTAKVQAESMIKKIDGSEAIKLDLSEESKQEKTSYEGRDTSKEGSDEKDQEQEHSGKDKSHFQKYKVKFNTITEKVELIDRRTGGLIETIKPEDLLSLLAKSKNASGILVDKEV